MRVVSFILAFTGVSASSARTRVSTGYGRLDEALQGGFLAGSAIVLSAPASDEVPVLLRRFLEVDPASLLISRSLSSAEPILGNKPDGLKCLVCSDKPVPPAQNTLPGKGIENLTELSLTITETINSLQPNRLVVQFLSDVLLRHKALQTRKWLSELLDKFRAKTITTLIVLNPYMHSSEEVQAIVDLFNGNIELIEKPQVEGELRKALVIKWMHGIETPEKEFPLVGLTTEPQTRSQQAVTATSVMEPRWLTPLVSRTAELTKLKIAFENALANRASVVALQGEAGVGKTRLMQELAVYAQSKNAVVLSGSALEDGLPYAPWTEVVRQYVGQSPGELLRRMLSSNASELVKLVPDIAAKLGTIPPSKVLGEQQDKMRFYEAVTQLFIAICKDTPLVLLFDDMQYVDQSSLDLLEYFVRSSGNLRVLTVCSVPAEHELESSDPLEQTLMKFNKQRLLESVTVKNLNKEDTTNLIKQVFGEQTLSHEFSDLIYQRTAGNPFFIEEVLRSLVEDGTIFRTEKGWDRKPIQEIEIPKSVKNALKSRLTKLDAETLTVLTTASIIGSEFGLDVLREVTQTQEDALLDRIEKTIAAGLVQEVPKRKDVFIFADSRIRDVLLGDIIQSRRIRYHVKIAEAMEKNYSKNLEGNAEAIATHFSEAGDTERTIKYSVMAGDRNMSIHAYEYAIQDFKRASDLIELEQARDQEKAAILEKLARALALAGRSQDSVRCYEQALSILEKLREFKTCARISVNLASAVSRAKGSEAIGQREAMRVLKRGLKYVEGDTEGFEAAQIYSELSFTSPVFSRTEARPITSEERNEYDTWVEKGLELGQKSNNFAATSLALASKASSLTDTGRVDEGLPLWEKALEVSLQHQQHLQAFRALLNLAIYWYPRDLNQARAFALQRLELSRKVNDISIEAGCWGWLSFLDWLRGDWVGALNESNKAFEIWERIGDMPVYYQVRSVTLRLTMGENLEESENQLTAIATRDLIVSSAVELNLALGRLRLEQGREEEAKACFEAGVNAFKDAEFETSPLINIETLLYLASINANNGELEKARSASNWAKKLAETLKSDAGMAIALQAEGSILQSQGNLVAAQEAYMKSLDLWAKADWPYYRAKALVEYAEAITKNSPDESRKRLEEAIVAFKRLGAKRDLEKTEAKLSLYLH